ncbi:MAG: hypothetical protein ACFWUJ_09375 [Pseudomonas fragi]|jgi:hypothetical protein
MDFKRTLLIAALPLAFCLSGVAQAEIKIKFAEVHPTGYPPVVAEQEMGKNSRNKATAIFPSRCLPVAYWAQRKKWSSNCSPARCR